MSASLTSLLVSVFSASILVILLSILILHENIVSYLNPRYLRLCILFIMVRCILPYEFFYTITFKSRRILPLVQEVRESSVLNLGITVEQLLLFIWIAVAFLKLVKLLFMQLRTECAIRRFPINRKMQALRELLVEKKMECSFQLVEIPQLYSPALVGLWHPKIIIPTGVPESDLHYILLHELEHYKHHDLYFIAALNILCVLYWWNPAIYLLRYSALKVLEYQVDAAVVQQVGKDNKFNYAQSILNILRLSNTQTFKGMFGIGLYEKQSDLEHRFRFILKVHEKKLGHYLPKIVFALVILSTVFIFEPYFIDKEDVANTFDLNGNCYLKAHNGTYDLYINNTYYLTIDNADGFENIPIYEED